MREFIDTSSGTLGAKQLVVETMHNTLSTPIYNILFSNY